MKILLLVFLLGGCSTSKKVPDDIQKNIDVIRDILSLKEKDIQHCYLRKQKVKKLDYDFKITTHFFITKKGMTKDISMFVEEGAEKVNSENISSCVKTEIGEVTFPPPPQKGIVEVTRPLEFRKK